MDLIRSITSIVVLVSKFPVGSSAKTISGFATNALAIPTMAGIEKVTSGEIIIKGRKIHKMSENNLAIG